MDLKLMGNRIKDRRVYLGLKQIDVAEAIGTSRSNYARYEAGDVDLNVSTLEALAKALNVRLSYFLPDESDDWGSNDEPIEAYYNGLPPESQSLVAAMIKAAHAEAKRAETTHGKKAE